MAQRRTGFTLAAALAVGAGVFSSPRLAGLDCNGNSVDDRLDLEAGTSEDCNGNRIPDECEFWLPQFVPASPHPLEGQPRGVVAADFDRDGSVDLAAGSRRLGSPSSAGVTVFLNRGERRFSSTTVSVGTALDWIAAGDLDGDGFPDLACAQSSRVLVLWNRNRGEFGKRRSPLEVGIEVHRVGCADLDADGRDDLVIVSKQHDRVLVWLQRDGGEFEQAGEYAAGDSPTALALGDFDGNESTDIATANRFSDDVSVLRNAGDGTFREPTRFPIAGERPEDLLAADLSGDGLLDLVVSMRTAAVVLLNQGNASFRAQDPFPVALPVLQLRAVATIDADGDGDLDIVASATRSDGISVVLNDGNGSLGPSRRIYLGSSALSGVRADLDNDGHPDLALGLAEATSLRVLWQDDASTQEVDPLTFSPGPRSSVGQEPHGAAMADMDGDGVQDIVSANGGFGTFSVLLNDGSGALVVRAGFSLGGYLISVAPEDLDADGDLDLAVSDLSGSRVLVIRNEGALRFPPQEITPYPVGPQPIEVVAADLNGDALPELITANRGASYISVLFNEGGGAFGVSQQVTTGNGSTAVVARDLDSDGDVDLAVANYGSSTCTVLRNDGSGSFPESTHHPLDVAPSDITSADFDRDGDPDLAVLLGRWAVLLENDGRAGFARHPQLNLAGTSPAGPPAAGFNVIGAGDLNDDELPDIFAAGGSVALLANAGKLSFDAPVALPVGGGPRGVFAADMDGDGDVDVVTANHDSQDISLLLNQGQSFHVPYLERVCTPLDFQIVSVPSQREGTVERSSKFIVPADPQDPSLLPPLFQNTRRFPYHEDFLAEEFPEQFPPGLYEPLVTRRATRRYFAGNLYRIRTDAGPLYGFSVIADFFSDPAELPTPAEVRGIHDTLGAVFTLRPLAYYPDTVPARRDAATWQDPGFPLHLDDPTAGLAYQAYTPGVGYGRVRILDAQEFESANRTGRISFQDILVLAQAPRDIEGVVSGVITAEPQGELSHIALRTARRGTPNAFVATALEDFKRLEGILVRLEVGHKLYEIERASPEEAAAWWEASRPRLDPLPPLDTDYAALDSLEEIDLSGVPEARYGGKASHFARLQRLLTGPFATYRARGFAIPVRYYLDFLRSNTTGALSDPFRLVTLEEYLLELFQDPSFQSDPELRFRLLEDFRARIEDGAQVDPELVRTLARRVEEVFATTRQNVRFRSSSNAEDGLLFSGAGLYDSLSACAADDLDFDTRGPSRCDLDRDSERGIERALKRVWASLWNFRAYEERAYFGLPQDQVAMGLLVSHAFRNERANGVAFTGNPQDPSDRRYFITAQIGEVSVVSPDPGVLPEKDILEVEDGKVTRIVRSIPSSLLPPRAVVLSDDELRELGALLWHIDQSFPLELGEQRRQDVLLDLEFKIDAGGQLALKQVRPYLAVASGPPPPVFELEVPPGTVACSVFLPGRSPREVYELKSTVQFAPGRVSLPSRDETFPAELFAEVLLGPERQAAVPQGPGTFRVERIPGRDRTEYRFRYEQAFSLGGGEPYTLELSGLKFHARDGIPVEPGRLLDEAYLVRELSLLGDLGALVSYSSCSYEMLALWEIRVVAEDGTRLRLLERHEPARDVTETGPASLVFAELELGGVAREVSDYWELVYASERHNQSPRYWVVLEPPAALAGLEAPVHAVECVAPEPRFGVAAAVRYLGADFQELGSTGVASFSREEGRKAGGDRFRRGDANGDGSADISDVFTILAHLFLQKPAPTCAAAGDTDDDGVLTLTDAIAILDFLFLGGKLPPPPFLSCGFDPTPDIGCEDYDGC